MQLFHVERRKEDIRDEEEDGVGMVRRFIGDANRTLKRIANGGMKIAPRSLHGSVITGSLFFPYLSRFVEALNESSKSRLRVIRATNSFFGEEVTVAGLLAGGDIINARDNIRGDFLIVPEQACLKSSHIFLDDLSLEDLIGKLGIPVTHGGASLSSMIERAMACQANL